MMNQFTTNPENPEQLLPGRDQQIGVKKLSASSESSVNSKKSQLSNSNGTEVKDSLSLLNEYRSDLEFTVWYTSNSSNAPLYTASVELDGKTYTAPGLSEEMAKQQLADVIVSQIGPHIFKRLTQGLTEKTECVEPASQTQQTSHEAGRQQEDFTSNDDIWTMASFHQYGTCGNKETVSDAQKSSSLMLTENYSAINHSTNQHKMSVMTVLKLLCPGSQIATEKTVTKTVNADETLEEYDTTLKMNGQVFKGRSTVKPLARAYAAEAGLNKIYGLHFERSKVGMPFLMGDTQKFHEIKQQIKEKQVLKMQKNQKKSMTDIPKAKLVLKAGVKKKSLDLDDSKKRLSVFYELFKGQYVFHYRHDEGKRGLEHFCSLAVGGIKVERSASNQKVAKRKAVQAAVGALKANGTYDKKVAEKASQRTGPPLKIALEQVQQKSSPLVALTNASSTVEEAPKMNATVKLMVLFPGSKCQQLSETFDEMGRKQVKVAMVVNEQTFTGIGTNPKFARAAASENALRTLGHWTSKDQKDKALIRAAAMAKKEAKAKAYLESLGRKKGFRVISLTKNTQTRCKPLMSCTVQNFGKSGVLSQGQIWDERMRTATRGHGIHSDVLLDNNLYDTKNVAGFESTNSKAMNEPQSRLNFARRQFPTASVGTKDLNKRLMKLTDGSTVSDSMSGEYGNRSNMNPEKGTYDATYDSYEAENIDSYTICDSRSEFCVNQDVDMRASFGNQDRGACSYIKWMADRSTVSDIMSGEYGNKSNTNPERETYDATYDSYRAENMDSYKICDSNEFCATQDIDMRDSFGNQDIGACSYISERPSYPWTGHRAGTARGHHISQYQGQRITNIAPLLKTNTIHYTGSCEAENMGSDWDMNEFYETYNMDTYDEAYNMRDFVGVKDKGSSYLYTTGVSSYQPTTRKASLTRGPRTQGQRLASHSVSGFANPSEFPYVGGKRH